MISSLENSEIICAVFGLCAVFLTFAAVFIAVLALVINRERKYILLSAVSAAIMLIIFQGITDTLNFTYGGIRALTFFGKALGYVPYTAAAAVLVLIAAYEIFLFVSLVCRRKAMLSENSVKESLDSLPDGVCFYSADGQPLLVNRQMQSICGELFDTEILNVNSFQKCIEEATDGIIRDEPTVIVKTKDGRVWDFHCSELNMNKAGLYELIAFDITEQYILGKELEERNERLNCINKRLRQISEEMAEITAEKELLNAKIDVHDNIGRSLLACRAYLTQNREERNRQSLLDLWRYAFSVMKKEVQQSDEWEVIRQTADMLGIAIELNGVVPEASDIRNAVAAAIRECLTNTVSHAGGSRLIVNISEDGTRLKAEFTNTGKPPDGKITETGGLKNLRCIVQRAGGIMTIESTPRFLLRLEFGKGE